MSGSHLVSTAQGSNRVWQHALAGGIIDVAVLRVATIERPLLELAQVCVDIAGFCRLRVY